MLDMFRGRRFPIAVPLALVAFWFGVLSPAAAGQPGGRQAMDADFETRIREWTTRPEFLSPLVDHLPASDTVPSPRDIIGHHVGAPRELTYYADLLAYYVRSPARRRVSRSVPSEVRTKAARWSW